MYRLLLGMGRVLLHVCELWRSLCIHYYSRLADAYYSRFDELRNMHLSGVYWCVYETNKTFETDDSFEKLKGENHWFCTIVWCNSK